MGMFHQREVERVGFHNRALVVNKHAAVARVVQRRVRSVDQRADVDSEQHDQRNEARCEMRVLPADDVRVLSEHRDGRKVDSQSDVAMKHFEQALERRNQEGVVDDELQNHFQVARLAACAQNRKLCASKAQA